MKLARFFCFICLAWGSISGGALAERLAISADIANIRSGPGSENDILWKAEKNYPIDAMERSGPWLHFKDYEGDEGWVHQSLVGKFKTVITKGQKNNVRKGPGTQHEIHFIIDDGIPFKVLGRENAWIHIEHADGDQGWIHKSLVW